MKELRNPSAINQPELGDPLGKYKPNTGQRSGFKVHNNNGFERGKGNNLYNRFRRKMRRDLFRG